MKFSQLIRQCGFRARQNFCRSFSPVLRYRRIRYVSTISRLTSAFNTKPSRNIISRFSETNKGLFGIQELTDPSGFKLLEDKVLTEINSLMKEACDPNRSRKMVTIFDELSDGICRVADMADFVRVSHPEEKWREAAENVCLTMCVLIEKLNTNTEIYQALLNVIQKGDVTETTEVDRRVAELFLFDFELSGIHLEESKRQQFVDINNIIMKISNQFMYNTQQATPCDILDLDEEMTKICTFNTQLGRNFFMEGKFFNRLSLLIHVRKYSVAAKGYCVSTGVRKPGKHGNDTEGSQLYLKSLRSENEYELVREAAYKMFLFPNPEQMDLLDRLLEGRRALATLVGFPSFAHRTLKGTLAETPENVMKFLWRLSDKIREGANTDYLNMKRDKLWHAEKFLKSTKKDQVALGKKAVRRSEVMPWDPVFYTQLKKSQLYDIDIIEEYFSLGSCMDGLSNLFECLFDITLETVKPSHGEIWNYDVYKLAVVHKNEGVLGHIYCDFYERHGKPNQDCHFTIQGGRVTRTGEYQLPKVVLHLNLPFPGTFFPSLLSPAMLENLFHEFGHAMHSMLGRTQYQHVTGTRCSIDFAEVPSVLMEYFASDPRVLKTFAKHYKTGKPIDDNLLKKFCRSKNIYIFSETQLQVMYAILDQIYHGEKIPKPKGALKPLTTTEILEEVQNRHYGLPFIPKTAWQLRFGHLVGYGGKYYSYLMSRSIASKIWRDFFKEDPFNRENGEKYRQKLLAHGGEKHPKELIADLFGEEPTIQMMIDSLTEDLTRRSQGIRD